MVSRRLFLAGLGAALGSNLYAWDEPGEKPLTLTNALKTLSVYSVRHENGSIKLHCKDYPLLGNCAYDYSTCGNIFSTKKGEESCRKKVDKKTADVCGTADPRSHIITLGTGKKRIFNVLTYSIGCEPGTDIVHELLHGYDDITYGREFYGDRFVSHPDVGRRAEKTRLEGERKTPAADLNLRDVVDVLKDFSLEHGGSNRIDGKTIFVGSGNVKDLISLLMQANNERIAEKYKIPSQPSEEVLRSRAAEIYSKLF